MLRGIVEAWIPCAGWLAGAILCLLVVLRLAGGRFEIGRLRRIHTCESGSVQTLSFVLTLPLFMMIVMFIIQVSQLMIAIAVVHHAAYAAARSASVWLPANTGYEQENVVAAGTIDRSVGRYPDWVTMNHTGQSAQNLGLVKLLRVWRAAAIACVPLSPSRRVTQAETAANPVSEALYQVYTRLVPKTASNPYMRVRIQRKTDYAQWNTLVVIRGRDVDGTTGPTYNPYPGYWSSQRDPETGIEVPIWVEWNPNEVPWEDGVTVTVYYNFAMLPGPGRFLSEQLTGGGTPDLVSRHLKDMQQLNPDRYEKGLAVVVLSAQATMQVEGLKSVIPHVQHD